MSDRRPNPEKLLKRIEEEERREKQGKLKIYLGAAPGVGKTYTMLQDAISKHAQGLDIIVGVVESHGREEIESLLKHLELLPRQHITYHNQSLTEFALDDALKRNPAIILVDEMAHTNIPGLRHDKRWQDINELLIRGIDVYTTLNVQHIESLNDIVGQIIHTKIKETVPDRMIELAESIELIDLPPEDLLKRLQEGKVYIPKQAEIAIENFFRKGNLIALRELALRTTAERVGEQVLLYRQGQNIKHIWPSQEKILVCVGPRMGSTKLIRAARRMAANLKTDWIAIYVDTLQHRFTEQRNRAVQNLRLAEQLGADTKIISGVDVVTEIINFAREQNITRIVLAKHKHSLFRRLFFSNLTDRIIRNSGEIDVFLLTDQPFELGNKKLKYLMEEAAFPWKPYAIGVGLTSFVTWISKLYFSQFPPILFMLYITATIIVASFGRVGPAVIASILSVAAYDYFFTQPIYSLAVQNTEDIITLIIFLLMMLIISYSIILSTFQKNAARSAEQRTATLHSLSRRLAANRGIGKLLEISTHVIATQFDSAVMALLPENNKFVIRAAYPTKQLITDKDLSIVNWVYELGQVAGSGTDTLPTSKSIYFPIVASKKPIGVLSVRPNNPNQLLTPEQMHLLEACVAQMALSLEVERLHEKTLAKKNA